MNAVILMLPFVAFSIGILLKDVPEIQQFMQQNINNFIWIIAVLVIISFALLILKQFMIKEISLK